MPDLLAPRQRAALQLSWSVCGPGCRVNKQPGANWLLVETRVRPWPQASTSSLVPPLHQRALLLLLLLLQPYSSRRPLKQEAPVVAVGAFRCGCATAVQRFPPLCYPSCPGQVPKERLIAFQLLSVDAGACSRWLPLPQLRSLIPADTEGRLQPSPRLPLSQVAQEVHHPLVAVLNWLFDYFFCVIFSRLL